MKNLLKKILMGVILDKMKCRDCGSKISLSNFLFLGGRCGWCDYDYDSIKCLEEDVPC